MTSRESLQDVVVVLLIDYVDRTNVHLYCVPDLYCIITAIWPL